MIITLLLALCASASVLAAAGPQQPVAKGPYLLEINVTESGLNMADIGSNTVISYANSSIFIGGVKTEIYSEPLILTGGDSLHFTSWHQHALGQQKLYIHQNLSKPVGLASPKSNVPKIGEMAEKSSQGDLVERGSNLMTPQWEFAVPEGAIETGFGYDGELRLNHDGKYDFVGCQTEALKNIKTYQVYWTGAGVPTENDDGEKLTCTKPLVIHQIRACNAAFLWRFRLLHSLPDEVPLPALSESGSRV
ncbi:MAG: hypothetical protein M1837_006104 [Sclerophora amabilis]|nr:MAG: hypothetical protein M1837_006104 [Sclerophora amabilis]